MTKKTDLIKYLTSLDSDEGEGQNKPTIIFLSTNILKITEVIRASLHWGLPYELTHLNNPIPEIQGSSEEIIKHKVKSAKREYDFDFIVEDSSLCFPHMNGFPGPYIKDFCDCRLLNQEMSGMKAEWVSWVGIVVRNGGTTHEVISKAEVKGTIVCYERGHHKTFETCFKPDGHDNVLSKLNKKERAKISPRCLAILECFRKLDISPTF